MKKYRNIEENYTQHKLKNVYKDEQIKIKLKTRKP